MLLSVLMVLSVFSGTATVVFADSNVRTAVADIYNGFEAPEGSSRAATTNLDYIETRYAGVIADLSKGLNNMSSEIDIRKYNINENELDNIVLYLVYYRQYYYIDDGYSYRYYIDDYGRTKIVSLIPTYIMSKSAVIAGNNLINNKMNALAAEASKLSTDIEKILYIHNYVVGNLEYDFDNYDQNHNNIYNALKDGVTMCVGYAETFNCAARRLGIKSYIVTSIANRHAWNLVYLDGRYYHVDCTFDDPSYDDESLLTNPVSGGYLYENLMCSDTVAASTGHIATDWEVNGINVYRYATSTTYDNFVWRNILGHIAYADGKWYVPVMKNVDSNGDVPEDATAENAGFIIYEVQFLDNVRYTVKQVRDINACYTVNGLQSILYLPVLQSLGNELYYRTNEGIFVYNPNSDTDRCVYASTRPDYNLYDFVIDKDNGTFSVVYGKHWDDNGIILEYKIKDYFCTGNHIYEWKSVNGVLAKKCVRCDSELKRLQFMDLDGCTEYGDYIEYTSVFNKFITGTNPPYNTMFSPRTAVTRAMFVTVLYRMAGSPYDNGNNPYRSNPFSDVLPNAYYYNAACWTLQNEITTETLFKPSNNVSREQAATFLFRYAGANDMIKDTAYQSVNIRNYPDYGSVHIWAQEPLQWANYNKMITGTQQGYLNPQGATQRVHATKILYGFGTSCNIGNFE